MLEIRGLTVFYGDARVLSDVDLQVGDAEIVSVVGSNGAGKTTLVNAIAGVVPARSGAILVDGTDVAAVPGHKVCDHGVAVVPEGRRIFPEMTVRDNLDLGAYRRAARREHARLLGWVHELFPVLRDRALQRAGTMSGGEQQMVAIGRALMCQPRVLLLDEPSLGLAPAVVDVIFDVVTEINAAGVSVLMVEQNVHRALEISTRGYLLAEGRIVLAGSPDELVAHPEVRRACLGLEPAGPGMTR